MTLAPTKQYIPHPAKTSLGTTRPVTAYLRKRGPLLPLSALLFILAGLSLFLSSCSNPRGSADENRNQRIVITGSSTLAPLIGDIAKRFESRRDNVRVDVQMGGSSRGIADARKGLADIGMVSRRLKSTESDLHSFAVARDGICMIAHKDNPIETLDPERIVAVYKGNVDNWKEIGGEDAPITVVNKAEGRSTLELFLEHFNLQNREIQADVVIGDNQQGIKTVAGNPHALGYVSVGTAEYEATHEVPIKLLSLQQFPASVENVGNGKFPLTRTLNLVTDSPPSGIVREFIDFTRSKDVHDIIQDNYFVAISD